MDDTAEGKTSDTTGSSADRSKEADRLVTTYAPAIFRLAVGLLNDRDLAEDVVQEVVFKAWRNLHTLRDPSLEKAWILRIAHNTSVSLGRRRRDTATDPADIPENRTTIDPERVAVGRAELRAVSKALDELDDRSRSIVLLREFEGLSIEDIAIVTDLAEPGVRTKLFRARRKLQQAVEDV